VPEPVTLLADGPRFPVGSPMATESACLLIADISGYTGYLAGVGLDHAQDILADLMGTIVTALRPGFRLAKLEGDAAFTFAITEKVDGSLLLDTIERCYFGFRRRRRDVRQATSCDCNACLRIPDLNLKSSSTTARSCASASPATRSCSDPTSSSSIACSRTTCSFRRASRHTRCSASSAPTRWISACPRSACAPPARRTSTSAPYPCGSTTSADAGRRRSRARASSSTSAKRSTGFGTPTSAPLQTVWEFVTTPDRRITWQLGVTGVELIATGNRRGVRVTRQVVGGAGPGR
jgi:uncharacterized protein DUF2652